MTQHVLAICTYPPSRQVNAREALDAILATALFGQQLSVLFCGDGVYQLLPGQGDFTAHGKPLSDSLAALPLYDVNAVLVDQQSLQERGLASAELVPGSKIVGAKEATELLANCARILSF